MALNKRKMRPTFLFLEKPSVIKLPKLFNDGFKVKFDVRPRERMALGWKPCWYLIRFRGVIIVKR
jgi:hypothetical protein